MSSPHRILSTGFLGRIITAAKGQKGDTGAPSTFPGPVGPSAKIYSVQGLPTNDSVVTADLNSGALVAGGAIAICVNPSSVHYGWLWAYEAINGVIEWRYKTNIRGPKGDIGIAGPPGITLASSAPATTGLPVGHIWIETPTYRMYRLENPGGGLSGTQWVLRSGNAWQIQEDLLGTGVFAGNISTLSGGAQDISSYNATVSWAILSNIMHTRFKFNIETSAPTAALLIDLGTAMPAIFGQAAAAINWAAGMTMVNQNGAPAYLSTYNISNTVLELRPLLNSIGATASQFPATQSYGYEIDILVTAEIPIL